MFRGDQPQIISTFKLLTGLTKFRNQGNYCKLLTMIPVVPDQFFDQFSALAGQLGDTQGQKNQL